MNQASTYENALSELIGQEFDKYLGQGRHITHKLVDSPQRVFIVVVVSKQNGAKIIE